MKLKLLMFLTIVFLFIGDIDTNDSITYVSLVDGYSGFSKMLNTLGQSPIYEDHTFKINIGDSITWNNNDPSDKITIISEQGLWGSDSAILIHAGRKYSYTFNNTGTYTFYIEEYKRFPKQTIIVSDLANSSVNISSIENTTDSNIGNITENTTDSNIGNITENTTDSNIGNITENTADSNIGNITENTTDSNIGNITENTTDSNIVSSTNTSTNPILAPLDILGNLKMTGILTFVVILIISLIKE